MIISDRHESELSMATAKTNLSTRMASRICNWDLDRLVPYANNPRTHTPEQVAMIAKSIEEFGFNNPILVDNQNGIIAGHGRLLAARMLGLERVPVVVLDHLSEAQRRAYIIADNKLAELAGWNEDLLSFELGVLQDGGFEMASIGFTDVELENLIDSFDHNMGLTDEDHIPEIPDEPISRLGDIWVLGRHRVACGDSTDAGAMRKMMGGVEADLLFTDPPYGMSYGGGRAMRKDEQGNEVKAHQEIQGDALQGQELIAMVRDVLANAVMFKKEEAASYVCFSWRTYREFEAALKAVGLKKTACLVWDKESIGLGYQHYRPQHEFIFYSDGVWHGDRSESDVWYFERESTAGYLHPTQKPVELIEKALLNSTSVESVILDPFGGSGSTLIACERNGRAARLMELDPKYVDVIIKRWQDYTGLEATLSESSESFEQVSKERTK